MQNLRNRVRQFKDSPRADPSEPRRCSKPQPTIAPEKRAAPGAMVGLAAPRTSTSVEVVAGSFRNHRGDMPAFTQMRWSKAAKQPRSAPLLPNAQTEPRASAPLTLRISAAPSVRSLTSCSILWFPPQPVADNSEPINSLPFDGSIYSIATCLLTDSRVENLAVPWRLFPSCSPFSRRPNAIWTHRGRERRRSASGSIEIHCDRDSCRVGR